uniref:Homologous recombination OB-fold protein OB-fold domain-containing protein n=1 Tax=Tanacetum cinerariifolium TaxID=118510 RepID=A0A6L2LJ65_TANCI|nr:hypothetical protein [Tanacetum cinerariifolium]
MDSNFNNKNEPWEFSLDIDDFDLHLTPVVRSSSITHVEPSPYTSNLVSIIPGPTGIVQLSSSTRVEPSPSTPNSVKIIPDPASIIQQAKLLKENDILLGWNGAKKLEQVVAIVKSCSLNMLGDLNVTLKDLLGTIHYKVLDVGSYGKDIIAGAAMILANVSVFTPIEVFRKDTVLENGSG